MNVILYNNFDSPTKLFSNLHLAKFLHVLAKSIFRVVILRIYFSDFSLFWSNATFEESCNQETTERRALVHVNGLMANRCSGQIPVVSRDANTPITRVSRLAPRPVSRNSNDKVVLSYHAETFPSPLFSSSIVFFFFFFVSSPSSSSSTTGSSKRVNSAIVYCQGRIIDKDI